MTNISNQRSRGIVGRTNQPRMDDTMTTAINAELSALADKANHSHQLATEAARSAIQHAIECGEILHRIKATLKHGEFGPWLKDNFQGSERSAQQYMKFSANTELVADASSQREAVALIANTKRAADLPPRQAIPSRPKSSRGLNRYVQDFETGKDNPHGIKVSLKFRSGKEVNEPMPLTPSGKLKVSVSATNATKAVKDLSEYYHRDQLLDVLMTVFDEREILEQLLRTQTKCRLIATLGTVDKDALPPADSVVDRMEQLLESAAGLGPGNFHKSVNDLRKLISKVGVRLTEANSAFELNPAIC